MMKKWYQSRNQGCRKLLRSYAHASWLNFQFSSESNGQINIRLPNSTAKCQLFPIFSQRKSKKDGQNFQKSPFDPLIASCFPQFANHKIGHFLHSCILSLIIWLHSISTCCRVHHWVISMNIFLKGDISIILNVKD